MISSLKKLYTHSISSPVGILFIAVDTKGMLQGIFFQKLPESLAEKFELQNNKYACGEVALQLEEYFSGKRQSFSLKHNFEGTEFQKAVLTSLEKVKYGECISYQELGRRMGRKDAARAVANVVATNPFPIVVPCHRIIPKSGGLGFYAVRSLPKEEGSRIKASLLALEQNL